MGKALRDFDGGAGTLKRVEDGGRAVWALEGESVEDVVLVVDGVESVDDRCCRESEDKLRSSVSPVSESVSESMISNFKSGIMVGGAEDSILADVKKV